MSKNTTSVSGLYKVWQRAKENWEQSFDHPSPEAPDEEHGDKCLQVVEDLHPAFAHLQANSLEDILLKLKVWRYQRAPGSADDFLSFEDRIAVSVIYDLERIIEGASKQIEDAA